MTDDMPTPEEERAWKLMAAQLEAMKQSARLSSQLDKAQAELEHLDGAYCSRLALALECVLLDYSGQHYDWALELLGEYANARETLHQRHCPTFMGEPIFKEARR